MFKAKKYMDISILGCLLVVITISCGPPEVDVEAMMVRQDQILERVIEGFGDQTIHSVEPTIMSEKFTPTTVNSYRTDLTDMRLKEMKVERVFSDIYFKRMVYLTHSNDQTDRLFLVLQPGRIMVFSRVGDLSYVETFLDIRHLVSDVGNEEGLLGLAFDPAYEDTGFFYVHYSAGNPKRSVVSRFKVDDSNPNFANHESERIFMEVRQPFSNHNGGQIEFGPDGYLYIGFGDGGSANDPRDNGQDTTTLLGTILRVDVSQIDLRGKYLIPSDNPFVDTSGGIRPEIWAYGLRNPWRFSFDRDTGDLWVGDVGQNRFEEIDLIKSGANYGWNVMEGSHCSSKKNTCNLSNMMLPIFQYGRDDGCSVTGGYVYRGTRNPPMFGAYIYGDFCSGKIWGLRYNGKEVIEHILIVDSELKISSFGEDQSGEIYILSFSGEIYRLASE